MLPFYIAAFLGDFALGCVLLAVPFFLINRFDATSAVLGLIGALGALFYTSGAIVVGKLSDRINRKHILSLGCALFALTVFFLPHTVTLRRFILFYPLLTISMCMFWPVIQSWMSQGLDKSKLNRSLSNFNVAWSAGLMLGYLASGYLFAIDPSLPFKAGALAVLAAGSLLIGQPVLSEHRSGKERDAFLRTEKDKPEHIALLLRIARIANFMGWFVVSTIRNLFPRLGHEMSFSTSAIGTLLFFIVLAQTVTFLFLGRTARWHYKIFPLILAQCAAVTALAVLGIASDRALLIAAMLTLGIAGGLGYFSSIFYGLYGFLDKGSNSGVHEAVLGAGTFFGPLIGGAAAYHFGLRAPYLSAMTLLAIAVCVEIAIYKAGMRRANRIKEA